MLKSFAYLFMLLPTYAVRDRIAFARDLVGPMRSPIRLPMLHMTLFELLNVGERHPKIVGWMRAVLADHQLRACTFALGRLIARPDIAMLKPIGPRSGLVSLRADLARMMTAAGLPASWRERFDPHVTLGRGLSREMTLPIDPIFWNADRIALVESWRGETHYEILETWSLVPPIQRSFEFG